MRLFKWGKKPAPGAPAPPPSFPITSPSATATPIAEVVDDSPTYWSNRTTAFSKRESEGLSAHLSSETIWKSIRFMPIIIGTLILLIAIALEHPSLLGHASPGKANEVHSTIFTSDTFILLASELGYAFIIAGIVFIFLEVNAKREIVSLFKVYQQEIKKSAFEAVYRIKHSDEYVRAVVGNCFESPLIREDYRIQYELDPLSPDIAKAAGVSADQFVMVTATINYNARNMGPDVGKFPTSYGIPFQPGKLEKYTRLNTLKVGAKTYSEEEIKSCETKGTTAEMTSEKTYSFEVPTDPGAVTAVAIEISIVKEISDNDAFGFRRPTVGAFIQFINRMDKVVRFGVTPRTSAILREMRPPSLRSGEWRIDGPILPFDSVILWWRPGAPPVEDSRNAAA